MGDTYYISLTMGLICLSDWHGFGIDKRHFSKRKRQMDREKERVVITNNGHKMRQCDMPYAF